MTGTGQVTRSAPERTSMNYAALREGGMELIRTLARDSWTDHNVHDPGITLLEAFSYAMTELGFRIQLDMPDLLQSGTAHALPDLAPAHRVLPCAPITPRDLRAVLLDHHLLRDARISTQAAAEIVFYANPESKLSFDYTPGAHPVAPRGLYEAVLEFADGTLNSNAYALDVTVDGKTYHLDIALPHWDEPEATPFRDGPVVNAISMPSDAGATWRPLKESQSYLGAMRVSYIGVDGPDSKNLWIVLRIADALQLSEQLTANILAEAQKAVQAVGDGTLIDSYVKRVQSAYGAMRRVQRYLSGWRNLCEDPVRIAAARVQEIAVRARIEVNGSADIEQLLACIFVAIDQMLAPPVRFVNLGERRAAGAGVEQIFDGPLLRSGFLDDDAFASDDARAVHVSDILRHIMRRRDPIGTDVVAQENPSGRNIVAVTDLALSNYINNRPITVDAQDCLHLVEIERYRPRLSLAKSRIVFVRNGAEIHYDMQRVESLFAAMQPAISRPTDPSVLWPVMRGEALPIDDYTPLQNDLPRIFGVGEARLPDNVGTERRAAVLQLKGYLLLFEQFLADLTAQLGNINRFFSAAPEEQATYFCHALFELPDMQRLLTRFPGNGNWAAFVADPDNPYRRALQDALEGRERFLDRRNRMFDHLLARQGEEMVAYGQELHRYAQKELTAEGIAAPALPARMKERRQAANARLIRAKAALLRDVPLLNATRLQAFGNPLRHRDDILRIDFDGARFVWTLTIDGVDLLRGVADSRAEAVIDAEEAAVLAAQGAWYVAAATGGGKQRYRLQDGAGGAARTVGESPQAYATVAAAKNAAKSCAQAFATLLLAESLSPLEIRIRHLCGIRSRIRRRLITAVGDFFEIYDEADNDPVIEKRWRLWEKSGHGGQVMLSSVHNFGASTDGDAVAMAENSIRDVLRHGQDEWNYAVTPAGVGTYNFELRHPSGSKIGLRNPSFPSAAAAERALEETLAHLYHLYSAEGFHLVEHLLLRPRADDRHANDYEFLSLRSGDGSRESDPYSHRLSLVFPSGYMRDFSSQASPAPRLDTAPHRFRDPEFRRHIERMVNQSCPAHLLPSIFWVDRQLPGAPAADGSFDSFEQAYFDWLATVLIPGTQLDAAAQARQRLVRVLNVIANG